MRISAEQQIKMLDPPFRMQLLLVWKITTDLVMAYLYKTCPIISVFFEIQQFLL
jgi:hypothetical protein